MADFKIKYTVYDKLNNVVKWDEIKVKNKINEFDAKVKLEIFLKKKYPNFNRLKIHECRKDILSYFDSMFRS